MQRNPPRPDPEAPEVLLAEPWRRLAAASTDALLIFAAHVAILSPLFALVVLDADPAWWLAAASTVASWSYVVLGWSRGATFGKKWWGVRIVQQNGAPMTFRAALARTLGYALACLPLRIGLWPIVTHPRRQGWHDQIARTLAVRAEPAPPIASLLAFLKSAFAHPRLAMLRARVASMPTVANRRSASGASTCAAWPVPDFASARRGLLWALLIYAGLAIALTWPVAARFSTHRAGDDGDGWVYLWNLWHFARALELGEPLAQTRLLFHPNEVTLAFHTMHWFNCVLALPLSRAMSLVAVYNVLLLGTLAASALGAYWLYACLSRRPAASIVGGAVFGFSPYFLAHGTGHPNLISGQFLPLFALAWLPVLRGAGLGWGAGAGVLLALNAWCDWHFFLFALLVAAILPAARWRVVARDWRRVWKPILAAVVVSGTLLGPLFVVTLRERGAAQHADKSGQSAGYRIDLAQLIESKSLRPSASATGSSGRVMDVERSVTLGLAIVLLAIVGVWRAWRSARARRALAPWGWVALAAVLLASGDRLTWRGAPPGGALAVIALGGPPGNGFGLPWDSEPILRACHSLALDPLLSPEIPLLLPTDQVRLAVPFLKPFRVIARFSVLFLLAAGLAATFGLGAAQVLARARLGAWASRVAWAVAGAIVVAEYAPWPYPHATAQLDPVYAYLARLPERGAVVEAPLGANPRAMYAQTVHGRPILAGNISRGTPAAFALVNSNALLRVLSGQDVPEKYFARPEQARRAALQELRRTDIRFLVVHRESRVAEEMARRLGLARVTESAGATVYRL